MKSILIVNATIINENSRKIGDIFIKNGRIEQIADKLYDDLSDYEEIIVI